VSIFKRSKDSDRPAPADPATETAQDDLDDDATEAEEATFVPVDRSAGPFDVTEVEGRDGRVDLGALWMRGVPGMELRLEIDQATQQVNAATAVIEDSALQLQAFAAPRSGRLWDEIRAEIAAAVETQGGTAEEHVGSLGAELRTRMPSAGPDGRTVFAPATFLGVDGPRWFLRGVLSGAALEDPEQAAIMEQVFQHIVVARGDAPMPPRELLELTLPAEAQQAMAEQSEEGEEGEGEERAPLNPFERGPEITEVR
jgi:hypothetical protein